jgi:hypothetical protein
LRRKSEANPPLIAYAVLGSEEILGEKIFRAIEGGMPRRKYTYRYPSLTHLFPYAKIKNDEEVTIILVNSISKAL